MTNTTKQTKKAKRHTNTAGPKGAYKTVRKTNKRKGEVRVPGKVACYAYLPTEEMNYIYSLSDKFNQSISHVLEKIVEAIRKDIVLELTYKEEERIKRARSLLKSEASHSRRRRRIKL